MRHVWEFANEAGYQQTRVLTYTASGGFFGVGVGNGYLKSVFASTSDLVFGMICEELGLILAITVVVAIALLVFYARSDVTRSRSTFYSISACAAAGMMLFQTCLNVFGATDVLPLTGVTLPLSAWEGPVWWQFGDYWHSLRPAMNALMRYENENRCSGRKAVRQ